MTGDDNADGPTDKTASHVPNLHLEFEEAGPEDKTIAEMFYEESHSFYYKVHTKDYIYNIFYRRPRVIEGNRHSAASARALSAYLARAYLGKESPEEAKAKIGVEEGYRRLEQISARQGGGRTLTQMLSNPLQSFPREWPITVEELLRWFGAQTRSIYTNRVIRKALLRNNLCTTPELQGLALDDEIEIGNDTRFIGPNEFNEDWLRTRREEEARCRMKFEVATARLAAWIDQNPGVGETEIRVKRAELDKTGFDELSSDESADRFSLYTKLVLGMDQKKNDHSEGSEQLRKISIKLQKNETVELVTVRKLLAWFGTERRSAYVNYMIRDALRINNLRTEPDWSEQSLNGTIGFQEGAKIEEIDVPIVEQLCLEFFFDRLEGWIDENPNAAREEIQARAAVLNEAQFDEVPSDQGTPQIIPFPVQTPKIAADARETVKEHLPPIIEPRGRNVPPDIDPTYRIGDLPSASRAPPSVKREQTVEQEFNILYPRNYPQLPIMQGERTVVGAVSLKSIAKHLAQGGKGTDKISNCIDFKMPTIKTFDTPLVDVLDDIREHEYVLIRDAVGKISGMVTHRDTTEALLPQGVPRILIKEIEGRMKDLTIRGGFSDDELRKYQLDEKPTIGGYMRLLEEKQNWLRLKLVGQDRVEFNKSLDEIREIRNAYAHPMQNEIDRGNVDILNAFVRRLRELQHALRPAEAC